jgi:hypothetical protein
VCHANHSHGFIIRDLRVLGERPLGRNCKVRRNREQRLYICVYRNLSSQAAAPGTVVPGEVGSRRDGPPRDRPPFLALTPLGWTRAPILFIGPSKGGRLTGCHLDPSPVLMTADLLVVRREADAVWIRYLFFGDDDFEFATRRWSANARASISAATVHPIWRVMVAGGRQCRRHQPRRGVTAGACGRARATAD